MSSAPLLIGTAVIAMAVLFACLLAPWLQHDMRCAVERGEPKPAPDVTGTTMMFVGGLILFGVPAFSAWLGVTA